MTRLLIEALVSAVALALGIVLAITRRQPLRNVLRREGDGLVVAASAVAIVILLLEFAVLFVINNR